MSGGQQPDSKLFLHMLDACAKSRGGQGCELIINSTIQSGKGVEYVGRPKKKKKSGRKGGALRDKDRGGAPVR